jgi:signal transduction histidine kinase/ligand-binding sensor domain-containing protein/DNA-binding response OmpR family regulator
MRNCLLLNLLLTLLGIIRADAQSHYLKSYQKKDGLSNNMVTSIIQDKKGFMWIGTRNGLNRFDGVAFKIFRNNQNDSLSIGNNSILCLAEGENEQLWVGTHEGIYLYDPEMENFSLFRDIPLKETKFLKADADHNIWIINNEILYRYNQEKKQTEEYKTRIPELQSISVSPGGDVWIATGNGIIKKYNRNSDDFTSYNLSELYGKRIIQLESILPVNDTTLLMGTGTGALAFHTGSLRISDSLKGMKLPRNIHIHTIMRQSDDEYWFGTETGLHILNISGKQIIQVSKDYNNPFSISDNVVISFLKDREGGSWIGTFFGGVNYYSRQGNVFQKYFPQNRPNSLSGNLIHEIVPDEAGNIWVGTEDAGLNKIGPDKNTITNFLPGNSKESISYRNIHGLLASGNELWVGTYGNGLEVLNIKTGKVVRRYKEGTKPGDLGNNYIVCIGTNRNRDILVGTFLGIYKYNKAADNFIKDPYFTMQIQNMHEDSDGTLWVASYGHGVYYLNTKTGLRGSLKMERKNASTIPSNYVNNLFEDSRHNIWFCTEAGVCKYDRNTKQIERYTNENELPDNQAFKILEDSKGFLWISTSNGLLRLDPETKKYRTYTIANGLLTDQFNYNSGFKSSDGRMYFGTVKGMISFNPDEFSRNSFIPPVYITGIAINNKEALTGAQNSPLNKSVQYISSITLPYDQSTISLNAAALSYAIPELNEYAYKMEGFDKGWTYLKSNRKIYYTKLPPGDYVFKMKGSNSEGVWNERETRLAIHIRPPVWASFGAYILYALIFISIIFVVIRYYHMAISEKNKRKIDSLEIEKEREIYNAKVEFFTNIAHEIRTPLTMIKLPLEKILENGSAYPQINDNLTMMKKQTNRLIDLSNQLLDFRKAEVQGLSLSFVESNINELLAGVYDGMKPAADQKGLTYKLEIPRHNLYADIDEEALKKILINLINNAIKYSENFVSLRLLPFSSEDTQFSIEVRNDGYIIPTALKDKIFEPFFRINETEHQPGTGIGLPLSRSLAELHKGLLEMRPSESGLNIFRLSLPVYQINKIRIQQDEVAEDLPLPENPPGATDPLKPAVLIAEDQADIRNFLRTELSPYYSIFEAHNGQDALALLQKENFQVVITDIMMPVMDGIELCRKIKTDLQFSHIPVIMLTAKNTLRSKIEGLDVGADAYIEKPFAFEHLKAQITNLISNRMIVKEYFARSPLTHLKGIASTKADSNFLEELNRIIYENIADMELDVDKLSTMMNMSRRTLYRKINALSDLSPNEWINLTRLKRSAELLAEGKYKMHDVAGMVGYSLLTNFSRDFHKQFGMSPSQYIASLNSKS